MNEEEARRFLLVRAVESSDPAAALLTREDRQAATHAARAQADGRWGDGAFLSARADFAYRRLATRFPPVERAAKATRWPSFVSWALPLGAFILGLLGNELAGGNRLNIIAFPLLGTLLWNLAVYLILLGGLIAALGRGGEPPRPPLLARWLAGAGGHRRFGAHQPLAGALGRFAGGWVTHAGRLITARTRRTLHLSAAALAAGIVAGMYLRALSVEYRAGWESTFIGSETLHALLSVVLAPASALTGIAVPDPGRLTSLQWSAGPGENAAPWIHLWAATALLFIIGPRLVLALLSAAAAFRLKRRLPGPGREDFYVRRLLREVRGEGANVRIIPYSFHPSPEAVRRLQHLLAAALGESVRTQADPPISYGGEDEWLAAARFGADTDHLLILFNLAATPEAENHGALVTGIRSALRRERSGAGLAAILDETAYRERLAGQAGADARIDSRRRAWAQVLQGTAHVAVDLASEDEAALVQKLESALVRDPSLVPERAA
jgi:hypothetical protein